jgi:putative phage-type endonuclease
MTDQQTVHLSHILPKAIDTGVRSTEREAWLNARMLGFSSSDTAALLGFDQDKSALAVYAEKLGKPIKEPSVELQELMDWGSDFEAPIIARYGRRTGHRVMQSGALLRHSEHPFLLQTVDGFDLDEGRQLEVKTYGDGFRVVRDKWKDEQIPRRVICQVQHQLLFGQVDVKLLALPLNERKLRIQVIVPHPEFQAFMLAQLAEHWDRLKRGHLPEPDASESSREALNAIYANADGSTVDLPAGWDATTDEYSKLSTLLRQGEERRDQIKNDLRAALGSASYGKVGDGRKWSLLEQAGPSHKCSECGHVDRGKGFRSPRLSGKVRTP